MISIYNFDICPTRNILSLQRHISISIWWWDDRRLRRVEWSEPESNRVALRLVLLSRPSEPCMVHDKSPTIESPAHSSLSSLPFWPVKTLGVGSIGSVPRFAPPRCRPRMTKSIGSLWVRGRSGRTWGPSRRTMAPTRSRPSLIAMTSGRPWTTSAPCISPTNGAAAPSTSPPRPSAWTLATTPWAFVLSPRNLSCPEIDRYWGKVFRKMYFSC